MNREHRRPATGNTGFPDHDPSADAQPPIDIARQGSRQQGHGPGYTGRTPEPAETDDVPASQEEPRQIPLGRKT
jgi:hypothetical protein